MLRKKRNVGHDIRLLNFYLIYFLINGFAAEETTVYENFENTVSPTVVTDKELSSLDTTQVTDKYIGSTEDSNHVVSRKLYFPTNSSDVHQDYEVLSNHTPVEINSTPSRNKNQSSPAHVVSFDLPPWPSKSIRSKKEDIQQSDQTLSRESSETDTLIEVTDNVNRLRYEDRYAVPTTVTIDEESALISPSDRQSYNAPSSPFVIMNNHQPRPKPNKFYSWVFDPNVDSGKTTTVFTSTSPTTHPKTTPSTKKPATLVEGQRKNNSSKIVMKNPGNRKTYKPYEFTPYSPTTHMPFSLTTPKSHSSSDTSVGQQSYRPLANFMSQAVITLANFMHKSFLNSLLVLIPSAILGLFLL